MAGRDAPSSLNEVVIPKSAPSTISFTKKLTFTLSKKYIKPKLTKNKTANGTSLVFVGMSPKNLGVKNKTSVPKLASLELL